MTQRGRIQQDESHCSFILDFNTDLWKAVNIPIRGYTFVQLSKLIDDPQKPLFSNSLSSFPSSSAQIATQAFNRKKKKIHFSSWAAFCFLHFLTPWCIQSWASPVAQTVKNPAAMQETQVQSLGLEDPLEQGMATHSSILAWGIPWTEEPSRL